MSKEGFEELVESICAKGCIEVNQIIILLDNGNPPPNLDFLSDSERQLLLKELKSIMDVYGGKTCSV
jgi:hypothetical protein